MIDPANTTVREVLTPDGKGTLKEIAYKDGHPITAKVWFYDTKGKVSAKQYKVEQLEEIKK